MKLVPPSFDILYPLYPDASDWHAMLTRIEVAGRTCYKSEDRITPASAATFVEMLLKRGHHAMIEHGGDISVRFFVDRGVSHELVRHRIAAFAQESTRFCNYSKAKFGSEITFIDARPHLHRDMHACWLGSLEDAETRYLHLVQHGVKPEIARSVLPNALKTEIVVTANVREWRHIFSLRTADAAHPQMREVMRPLLAEFRRRVPVLFDDVGTVE